ncbi:MAG TPA: GGDEF domain-containing protein [Vulgatibacter sp.]
MALDVPTLAIATLLIGLEVALGFLLVAGMLGRHPGLRFWIFCPALVFAGGTLSWALRFVLPLPLLVVVTNGTIYLGMVFAWAGARDFCGVPLSIRPWAVWFVPFLAAIAYYSAVVPSTRARVIVASFASAVISIATAWTLLRHRPAELRISAGIAGTTFLLHGLFHLARMFFPQGGTTPADLLQPGWPRVAFAVEGIVASLATLLALLALVSHKLISDLAKAARYDVLTGVLNRRTLDDEASRTAALSAGLGLPCAVLMMDLDHFKEVNDTFGHPAGDAALRHFAAVVSSALRSTDVFGRYGGEEFVVLIPGASASHARAAAERLRALVAASPVSFEGREIPLTVSVGIAWEDAAESGFVALLGRADAALYLAKDGGRDRVIEAAA